MCGIVGYIGDKDCVDILINSLKRLEYRGYDSAGIATVANEQISCRRCQGKIKRLETIIKKEPIKGNIGIAHTRWATHGVPSDENAHPHIVGSIAVVHNGIIENYFSLKKGLEAEGAKFSSNTDTEVIAHLIARYKNLPLEEAVNEAIRLVEGSFAVAILSSEEPDKLIAVRKESPLIVGLGDGEYFLASDAPALLPYTKKVIFMNDGEMAIVKKDRLVIKDFNRNVLKRESVELPWSPLMAEKAGYKHFMQKEIFEQPRAVANTVRPRLDFAKKRIHFEHFNLSKREAKNIHKIWIVACGTSWHASLVGRHMIERICGIPVEVDLGSEFKYRKPIIDKNMLLILISQSGETADTLAALREGKRKRAKILGICNVLGSTLTRECDWVIYTHAGPEIGVASTKAFTTQIAVLYLFSLYMSLILGKVNKEEIDGHFENLLKLPHLMEGILSNVHEIEALALKYGRAQNFLYLGRGLYYPIALEGALKLKEISYVHAEGYPAGEMKHGPIALIDENMPVVVLAPKDETYLKILANMEEVRSRQGKIIAVTEPHCIEAKEKAGDVLSIPPMDSPLKSILFTVPLQLLAYYIAVYRGTDVDQPRNLAKSVTVE
ncbi:MAG: glutamine amidotransferase [Syntrophobacter sp. DG_60]|nr:MAG: glutamine amidotransferase [Syntrophobacter sp. DG_60]